MSRRKIYDQYMTPLLRRALLFLCSSICCSIVSLAQNDSTDYDWWNEHDPKIIRIKEARKALAEEFRQGNMERVKELDALLLDSLQDPARDVYWLDEGFAVHYCTCDFRQVLYEAERYKEINGYHEGVRNRFSPIDTVLRVVIRSMQDSQQAIRERIIAAYPVGEEREFLTLNLDYLNRYGSKDSTKINLAQRCADFLKRYPQTPYKEYMNDEMLEQLPHHRTNLFYSVGVSTGWMKFSGGFNDAFQLNKAPAVMTFDIHYEQWLFQVEGVLGGAWAKQSLHTGTPVWNRGVEADFSNTNVSVGYAASYSYAGEIIPFIGIGDVTFRPGTDDRNAYPQLNGIDRIYYFSYVAGVAIESYGARHEGGPFYLKMRSAVFFPQCRPDYGVFSGEVFYFALGLGFRFN